MAETSVLIDDLSKDHRFMGYFLKRWCDHYPFRAEYKGGSKTIRPRAIIVTSNYSIEDIFGDDQVLVGAIKRRFKVKHFLDPLMGNPCAVARGRAQGEDVLHVGGMCIHDIE